MENSLWLLFVLVAVLALALLVIFSPWLLQPATGKGHHVAEVWLEWSLGRGSTLYRQRFATKRQAYIYVRFYAWFLDFLLPTHFVSTGRDGRRVMVSHDMSIRYGVRLATADEQKDFRKIWSPSMPGTSSFSGEHAEAHPMTVANHQLNASEPDLRL